MRASEVVVSVVSLVGSLVSAVSEELGFSASVVAGTGDSVLSASSVVSDSTGTA